MKKSILLSILYLFAAIGMAAPLPANEAFQVEVKPIDPNNFAINWQIKPGYFLYSERIHITAAKNSNIQLGEIRLPEPLKKVDSQGRINTVYRDALSLPVPVLSEQPGEALIDLTYQGCSDGGFCYPPETRQIKITTDDQLALTDVAFFSDNTANSNPIEKSDSAKVESLFSNNHWGMILLSFFGFGLLLSFTPCILPMIPVLSGIILGHGPTLSTRKAFLLSLSYVMSMAITYAIVGAIVAKLGSNLQIIMQSPWAVGLFSVLFVLLALSMFGYFELKFPTSWQAKLAKINRNQASGHYIGAAIMGCLSTLILSPCVTAPLIGALGYIAHSGNIVMGSFSLFFLGLGMGTPLLLIGTSAGRWLPKAGVWMNGVKAFFGVLLLGVAISLLSRILPSFVEMLLWSALLIFSGVFSGALVYSTSHHDKLRQGFGLILLLYGVLILIGASLGNNNPLQPLTGLGSAVNTPSSSITQQVVTATNIQEAIAKANGKPIMLDFYADWCNSCKAMEATTFKDTQVLNALKDFVVLKVDVTANNPSNKALLQRYNVVAPPTFLFFNKDGKELEQARLVGEVNSKKFLKHLLLVNDPG